MVNIIIITIPTIFATNYEQLQLTALIACYFNFSLQQFLVFIIIWTFWCLFICPFYYYYNFTYSVCYTLNIYKNKLPILIVPYNAF